MVQIEIKSKFEFFRKNNIVYLDNAATTQVPDEVIKGVEQTLEYRGNPNRGAHPVADRNRKWIDEARENIARFINAKTDEIIFTGNTTDSINLAVDAVSHLIEKGDEIVIPVSEHHSNLLPFEKLIKKGAKLKTVHLKEGVVCLDQIKKAVGKKTKIVALGHVSNVLGSINPVVEVGKFLKTEHPKVIYFVDGAQAVAHIPVDVKNIFCDIYAFSSHKMYGPCGVGVLYLSTKLLPQLKPVKSGGGTVKSVSLVKAEDWYDLVIDFKQGLVVLEGGTPNTSNIIGLSKAVSFIRKIGFDYILDHEKALSERLVSQLKEIPEIKIFGPTDISKRVGVVSFIINNIPTKEAGEYFDKHKICIRYGSHCAFPLIDYLGSETIRVSLGVYNDEADIDTFIQELRFFIDKKQGKIINPHLEVLRSKPFYRFMYAVNSKDQIIDKIITAASFAPDTEVFIMAGHFLAVPDKETNQFFPSIKYLLPERLHGLLEEFGMTTFPIFTWDLGCEIVRTLKEKKYKAKLVIIANNTTGINELKNSPINATLKTAETYEEELLAKFKAPNIPVMYLEILNKYGLNETDILGDMGEKYFDEKSLRQRFKNFVADNNEYFDGMLNYKPLKDGSWDLSINILDNQEIKTCRFDTFGSKTGGKFCIVEVCEFLTELCGLGDGVNFQKTPQRYKKPLSASKNKMVVMLTPAMCNDAVTSSAELYLKLMLQEKHDGSFKFFNVPLGPNAEGYLARGATLKYLSDKGNIEELSVDKEPSFAELWKLCEYNLLYDAQEYADEMEELFKNIGINKKSNLLDTCVGPGFFCTELLERGYSLKTADMDKDSVIPFVETLKEKGINQEVVLSTWLSLPEHFKNNSFDMLFNRGNTFIYAAGGWNVAEPSSKENSIDAFRRTLKVYYDLLKSGGYLYLDKFKDSEIPAKKVAARLYIGKTGEKKDIVFSVERRPEEERRYAQLLLRDVDGNETGLPNVAYDLSESEVEDLLKETGFVQVKKIKLRSEKHFVVWLAKK